MPRATWTLPLFLTGIAVSAAIYTHGLDRVPAYLSLDEAHFAVHAASLAESGRNLNGQILPPLISLEDPEGEPFDLPWGTTYYLPFGMYIIAAALKVLPLSEAAVRTPSALLGGVINVALIFAVALALFRNRLAAAASAVALSMAPAHVIISRQAIDSVCQMPFVLGGLWCIGAHLQKPDPRIALAAGAILGCGVYAYVTSIVFMPFYLALFWFAAWYAGILDRGAVAWSTAGFVVAVLPLAFWLAFHPEAVRSLQMQYNRADPGSVTLMNAFASGGIRAAAGEAIRIYWSYFDPSFLFVVGGNARNLSTGNVGVFLLPVAVLAPLGFYYLRGHGIVRLLVVIGLLAAPLPAVIKGSPYAVQRASGLLIYVSLLAGFGLASLAVSTRAMARAGAAVLVVLMTWQFASFYREYHGNYRNYSAPAYDPTAFREAAESIIASDRERAVDAVYMPAGYYDAGAKWHFYTLKHDRLTLWRRTRYFKDRSELDAAPSSGMALLPQGFGAPPEGWETIQLVQNAGGEPIAAVIRRR